MNFANKFRSDSNAVEQEKGCNDGPFPASYLSSELEHEYEEDYFQRSLVPQRRGLFGILLISLFTGVLNVFLPPRARAITLSAHYLLLCPMLVGLVVSTYLPIYRRFSQQLISLGVLLFAAAYIGFEFVAPTVRGSEASRTTVVLILVVMAASTVLRIQYRFAAICCYVCFFVYGILSFTSFHLPEPAWNVGALLAACALGNFITRHTERSARSDFLLRHVLEQERQKLDSQNIILDEQNQRLNEVAELRLQSAIHAEHEIRNKLNSIGKPIEIAVRSLERGGDPAKYKQYLNDAICGISDLNHLLQMMLNIARLKAGYDPDLGAPTRECLDKIIGDVCDRKTAELNHPFESMEFALPRLGKLRIKVELHPAASPILLHRYAVRLVLENLLENAVKYSIYGGCITISTSEANGEAIICIADQGIGISKEQLVCLFDGGYERGRATDLGVTGTGIGLQIIKKLINAQSGRIWAESDGEDQGARFFMAFRLQAVSEVFSAIGFLVKFVSC